MSNGVELVSIGQVLVQEVSEQVIELQVPSAPVTVQVVTEGPQGPEAAALSLPRGLTIVAPQAGDAFTFFRTSVETPFVSVLGLVSNGSVTFEVRYGSDRTGTGTLAIDATTVTSTTTGDAATLQNQPVPAGVYVWVKILAVSGAVSEFNVSIGF